MNDEIKIDSSVHKFFGTLFAFFALLAMGYFHNKMKEAEQYKIHTEFVKHQNKITYANNSVFLSDSTYIKNNSTRLVKHEEIF